MKRCFTFSLALVTCLASAQSTLLSLQPDPSQSKDAMVWSINPSTNYGNNVEGTITTWTYTGSPSTKRFYIEFDMSAIPAGASIDSAFFFFYNNPNAPSHNGEHSGSNAFLIRRVTSPWAESTITFGNQPTSTTQNEVLVPATTNMHQDFKIDVTALVEDQLANVNHGFFIRLQTESTYRAVVCASSDVTTSSIRPKLEIYYNSCVDPEAGFSSQITSNTVQFSDTSLGTGIYAYYWDFGDGTFSYNQNPIKTYASSSSYNVCLTITDSCGTDTTCQTISLCSPTKPTFYYNLQGNLSYQFQALPTNALSYLWSFGDGNFSALQNPLYTFSQGGKYPVCLTVTDSCGTDSSCTTLAVSGLSTEEFSLVDFNAFPIPAKDVLHINGPLQTIKEIRLFNLNGSCTKYIYEDFEHISIENLAKGFYILEISSKDKKHYLKISKE